LAAWCAAFLLSIVAWLAYAPPVWLTGFTAVLLFGAGTLALRVAMLRRGSRPAIVSVAIRISLLLILAPGLFLALALVIGNDDAELASGIWWLDYAHLAMAMIYFAGPGHAFSSVTSLQFTHAQEELLAAIVLSGAAYLVAAAAILGIAALIALRFLPRDRSPASVA
jgi:hypothetical protein